LEDGKSINENHIYNNANINVLNKQKFYIFSGCIDIDIIFVKDGSTLTIKANSDDLFFEVVEKYLYKTGFDYHNTSFYYNSKLLYPDSGKSIEEYNIINKSIIQVINKSIIQETNKSIIQVTNVLLPLNIDFFFNGRTITLQGESKTKFCDLVNKFKIKALLQSYDQPKFIYKSCQISPKDQRTLKELKFGNFNSIDVFLQKDIIGG